MSGARRLRPAKTGVHDDLSRRAFRTLVGPLCLICLTAGIAAFLSTRRAGPNLVDLEPKIPLADGFVLVAWYDLERVQRSLKAEGLSTGTPTRALGYMIEGDTPIPDGASVGSFVLLPDAGSPMHPAHRHGDQMIAVRLAAGSTIYFSHGGLVWASGWLRILPGDPEGREPLYVLESARAEPAVKTDIAKYFR